MTSYEFYPSRSEELLFSLLDIWESSVRHTHHFLSEQDIAALRPLVLQGMKEIGHLLTCMDDNRQPLGFIGVQDHKIEMLFVSPDATGTGIGKKLVTRVLQELGVHSVDVNEQNPRALGFYEHMGFRVFDRSDQDDQGNPFPILHMKMP
ncbi:GNAT family N-acetyltransferase [Paenibacillus sp. PK3_47]|uniref:GNAT family N-acetyltransferase n=1 Tax=Paenibacillus sp. PK3_47 TaxID=2072642 RepID=UPI00201D5624|nr:GNAT family N-acetyltransferase [Paenibacillus sp. PK3_47]UQZ34876.1 GNAT family N-acetyltransferase [Paenibacillus sp. PK3_47]